MSIRTGKIGKRYETTYYFQQEYIKWDYQGVPFYHTIFFISNKSYSTISSKMHNHHIFYKGNKICSTLDIKTQTLLREDLYAENKYLIRTSIQSKNSAPNLLKDIIILHIKSDAQQINFDEDINEELIYPDTYYYDYITTTNNRLFNTDKIMVSLKTKSGTIPFALCYSNIEADSYNTTRIDLTSDVIVPYLNFTKYTRNTHLINNLNLKKQKYLFVTGTKETDIHIQHSGFQDTTNTIYEKEHSFYHNQTNTVNNTNTLFLLNIHEKETDININYNIQQDSSRTYHRIFYFAFVESSTI